MDPTHSWFWHWIFRVSNSGERRQEIGRATAQGAAIFAPDYRQRSSCESYYVILHVPFSFLKNLRPLQYSIILAVLDITVHRQAILLLVVESGTRKFRRLSVECLFVESGTYDVIYQFCTVKGMVVESEVLKSQSCALSKLRLPMHSNGRFAMHFSSPHCWGTLGPLFAQF